MILETCISEDPREHWKHLECEGRVVVDFGCGRWQASPEWPTTPEYFMSKKAELVYAIDSNHAELTYYETQRRHTGPLIVPMHKSINSVDDFRDIYAVDPRPEVAKIDIEGAERFLFNLTDAELRQIERYAIETHSYQLYLAMIARLGSCGFAISRTVILAHTPCCMVIYAERMIEGSIARIDSISFGAKKTEKLKIVEDFDVSSRVDVSEQ